MKYSPLPNDVIRKHDQKPVTILRVFPFEIVVAQEGGVDKKMPLTTFNDQLAKAVSENAYVERNGSIIYPEPTHSTPTPTPIPMNTENETKQGLTGSSNAHARLSPSDSKRWTNCTASIAFQEANDHRVIDSSSRAADEGTEAHEWAAKVLMGEITISQIPESFREPVESYCLDCFDLGVGVRSSLNTCVEEADLGFDPPLAAYFVEEQIPLFYQPEQYGTADWLSLVCGEDGTVAKLYGRDYKHGAGVLVTTEENTQLAIYVYSAIVRLQSAYKFRDDTVIDLAIIQPRHRESDYQKPWIITLADLRSFCEDITSQAAVAREAAEQVRAAIGAPGRDVSCDEISEAAPNSVFAPSEGDAGACRWCKCKAFCSVRLSKNTDGVSLPDLDAGALLLAMPEFKDGSVTTTGNVNQVITDDYLANLIAKKKGLISFLNDVEEYLENRLLNGEEIEGLKLVDGREGNRDWTNTDEVDTFLKGQGLKQEDRYNFKLKSPAVIEKVLKDKLKKTVRTKNRFEELITRSPAKKKLAVGGDLREAVPPLLGSMPNMDEGFEV